MKAPITVKIDNLCEGGVHITADVLGGIRFEDIGKPDADLQPPYIVHVVVRPLLSGNINGRRAADDDDRRYGVTCERCGWVDIDTINGCDLCQLSRCSGSPRSSAEVRSEL